MQFEIPTGPDEYLRLDDMYLFVKVKPVCENLPGKTAVEYDKIGLVNYCQHSMIKNVDVFIGDTQITSAHSSIHIVQYLRHFSAMEKMQRSRT